MCLYYNATFKTLQEHKNHSKMHCVYSCNICFARFVSEPALVRHRREFHDIVPWYSQQGATRMTNQSAIPTQHMCLLLVLLKGRFITEVFFTIFEYYLVFLTMFCYCLHCVQCVVQTKLTFILYIWMEFLNVCHPCMPTL